MYNPNNIVDQMLLSEDTVTQMPPMSINQTPPPVPEHSLPSSLLFLTNDNQNNNFSHSVSMLSGSTKPQFGTGPVEYRGITGISDEERAFLKVTIYEQKV